MGCETSKICGSKNNTSKKCIAKLLKLGLRQEEANHVLKFFKEQRFVKRTIIRDSWHTLVTPVIMDLYENYLVHNSDKKNGEDTVDVYSFSLFLSNFVKGTAEERLNIYSFFLKIGDDEEVPVDAIIKYLVELMKSVLILMEAKNVTQFTQWSSKSSEYTDEYLGKWGLATIRNVYESKEVQMMEVDKMTSWLTINTDITWLQCYLFYSLYEMEKIETHCSGDQKGVNCPLPYLVKNDENDDKDDWKAVFSIPAIIFINSHLPTENRYQWRLAYSVDIHGESFTTFRSLISNRGPTILVIRDREDHIFGGFASTSWSVGPQFFGDQRCFLFSLLPVMKIYPTLPHNDHFLYLNANQKSLPNGLGMGGQLGYWGLWIDASFEFGNCSPSCSTYADYKMLSGSQTFNIAGLQVWCAEGNTSDSEDGSTYNSVTGYLRRDQDVNSILHKDPGARALMDMMGKTGSGIDFLENPN